MTIFSVLKEELQNIKGTNLSKEGDDVTFIKIKNKELLKVLKLLKNSKKTQFRQLLDITAVDYPEKNSRFELVYILLSHKFNHRIILKTFFKENERVPSISRLYLNAKWPEREIYDMFGIEFAANYKVTRILNEDNFEGFPLRKDFPQNGTKELFYNEDKQEFIYKDIKKENTNLFNMVEFSKSKKELKNG